MLSRKISPAKERGGLDDIARSFLRLGSTVLTTIRSGQAAPLLRYVFGVAKRAPASFALLCLEPE